MHNKSWIADNRVALVGGRNLGDEYFTASDEVNFVDLDFAMIGPVVRDVTASFDRFWNSSAAWPLEVLDEELVSEAALATLRAKLAEYAAERAAERVRAGPARQRRLSGGWSRATGPLQWSSKYRFVSDDPAKVTMQKKDAARAVVAAAVVEQLRNARSSLEIISPYFVPGDKGSEVLIARAKAGAAVQVLTNSLAANDVATVHGGYSRHRKALLEGGVQLFELKPLAGTNPRAFSGSSGASLHTKALTADGNTLFVGSYNLDPRSTWLNCEQGVLVEDAALAAQLSGIFRLQSAANRAWKVTLDAGELRWNDGGEDPGFRTAGIGLAKIPGLVRACVSSRRAALARNALCSPANGGEHDQAIHFDRGHGACCAGRVGAERLPMNGIRCSTARTSPAGPSRSPSIRSGENYADTFRVEDGVIKVSYDRYGKFDEPVRPPVLEPGVLKLHPAARIQDHRQRRRRFAALGQAQQRRDDPFAVAAQHETGPGVPGEHGIPVPRRWAPPRAGRPAMCARRAPISR